MNQGTTIAPHILFISLFLTVTWGIYFLYTVRDWAIRRGAARMRRMLVALCVWSLPLSFVLRTTLVIVGMGTEQIGIVSFFAITGINIVGSIFAVATLRSE